MTQAVKITQARYDCRGTAAQTFLQRRWKNGITLLEMEDFQVAHLNNVSPAR